jgi:hypothetical protein
MDRTISAKQQNAFASCICRGLRQSGSNNRALPTAMTAVIAGKSPHSAGSSCTKTPSHGARLPATTVAGDDRASSLEWVV